MLIDLADHDGPRDLDCDLCIVGGGPAGICIAQEFAGTNRSVVLLEAGLAEMDPASQALNLGLAEGPIADQYPFYLASSRRRVFGGSQMLWGGWCTTFTEQDFAFRSWVPDSGWPLTFQEILPWYERAAHICGLHRSTVQPSPGNPVLGGDVIERQYSFAPDRVTVRETFEDMLRLAENVKIFLGANVTGIRWNRDNTLISKVVVRSLNGVERVISPKAIVLAAGGIENARLLLANRPGERDAFTGSCFMEHPHVVIGEVRLPGNRDWSRYAEHINPQLGHTVMSALAVTAEAQSHHRLLNSTVQLLPDESDESRASLVLRAEQQPNRRSRVTLGEKCDPLGVPVAELHWDLDDADWTSVCLSAEIVASALSRCAGARVELQTTLDSPWPRFALNAAHYNPWGCHHMGTTRMSQDPRLGVVDVDTRVHGTGNLFVAGSSVFPTGGYANPTLTLMALALRTAGHLSSLI